LIRGRLTREKIQVREKNNGNQKKGDLRKNTQRKIAKEHTQSKAEIRGI